MQSFRTILTDSDVKPFIESQVGGGLGAYFDKLSLDKKVGLVTNYIIGPESERFSPQPVYGPTGKGFLKSKGVDGLVAEGELIKKLNSPNGRKMVREFSRKVSQRLSKEFSSASR